MLQYQVPANYNPTPRTSKSLHMPTAQIRRVDDGDQAEWLRMRNLLWPDCPGAQHAEEITAFFGAPSTGWSRPFLAVAAFVAVRPVGALCGFLEASIRPYAEDCRTWPVGYVEGWFVDAD